MYSVYTLPSSLPLNIDAHSIKHQPSAILCLPQRRILLHKFHFIINILTARARIGYASFTFISRLLLVHCLIYCRHSTSLRYGNEREKEETIKSEIKKKKRKNREYEAENNYSRFSLYIFGIASVPSPFELEKIKFILKYLLFPSIQCAKCVSIKLIPCR